MPEAADNPLKVENSLDILLLLLYAPGGSEKCGEPIEGITRLQKLMFLLKEGEGPKSLVETAEREIEFKAFKMGPYAESLQSDLDELLSIGLIRTKRLRYLIADDGDAEGNEGRVYGSGQKREVVESLKYELTDIGTQAGKELWESLDEKTREGLTKFKTFFGSLSLRQLLIFVYDKFPQMTGKSEIREKLRF